MNKFWRVVGDREPVYQHTTYGSAFREAERLCKLYNKQFIVLEAKCAIAPQPVEIENGSSIPIYYR